MRFSIIDRLASFRFALAGIGTVLKSQHNAWIHLIATGVVVVLGFLLGVDRSVWCWVVVAIVMVWTAEAFNTALEFLADALHPEHHPKVGKAKDAAAGAVLISAIGAAVIGLLVFIPHL